MTHNTGMAARRSSGGVQLAAWRSVAEPAVADYAGVLDGGAPADQPYRSRRPRGARRAPAEVVACGR